MHHDSHTPTGFGPLLRGWRRSRRASQLQLALSCDVSQRHLSFLESGRSRPSRDMVLRLASVLDVPLDQQNAMLLAAGFAPVFLKRELDAPEMRSVDHAIGHVLDRQEPYPALLVDGAYTVLRTNGAMVTLLAFLLGPEAATAAARHPMNAVELLLRPDGLRPVMENWEEVATWVVRRLRAETMLAVGDDEIGELVDRVLELPDVAIAERTTRVAHPLPPTLALRFRKDGVRLALFSMIATVGTPLDVSLQHMRLELFFPSDEATSDWLVSSSER